MNGQFEAAWQLDRFLTEREIPYAIIGGLAVQRWGRPRLTVDVDLTALVPLGEEEAVVRELLETFQARLSDALELALKRRILPLRVPGASDVDVSLALPGYEEEVVRRTAALNIGEGRVVGVCSAEDLLVHKAVAGRGQDIMDIEGIIGRRRRRLDLDYIRQWLRFFAESEADPRIQARFEEPWRRLMGEAPPSG